MRGTRERIIASVIGLFDRQGFHATGLNQIVAESKAPKGSLYYYFPGGKEEIASVAVETVGRTIAGRISQTLDEIDDPADAISALILQVANYVEAHGMQGGCPVTTVALDMSGTSERLAAVCVAAYDSWEVLFARKLVGSGFSDERAATLAILINSTIEGAAILSRTRKELSPLRIAAEEISRLIRVTHRA